MTTGEERGRGRRDGLSGLLRPAIIVALVVVVTLGVSARAGTWITFSKPPTVPDAAITIPLLVVEVMGAVLLLVGLGLSVRRRRKPPDEVVQERPPIPWWFRLVATAVALVAIALPVVFLLLARTHVVPSRHSHAVPTGIPAPATRGPAPTTPGHAVGWAWPAILLGIALVALVLILLFVRRRRSRAMPVPDPGGDSGIVSEAAVAGGAALRAADEPRDAVIGCYEAMERVLADAGVGRAPAQTPEEMLEAAAANGAVPSGESARSLVELFGRARFSNRAITADDVAVARRALAALAPAGVPG